jgi:hypothetical protein
MSEQHRKGARRGVNRSHVGSVKIHGGDLAALAWVRESQPVLICELYGRQWMLLLNFCRSFKSADPMRKVGLHLVARFRSLTQQYRKLAGRLRTLLLDLVLIPCTLRVKCTRAGAPIFAVLPRICDRGCFDGNKTIYSGCDPSWSGQGVVPCQIRTMRLWFAYAIWHDTHRVRS